ncbi:MAG: hypothetical protein A2289_13085 [Deltaproteobacteria bacterium RIFOXYA12_FULL_58_15]|nr:MAG: hypothetical protein A2289_13085 [Deltaproteobacteria bacterium RIFOXYA12_FULL_58_15]
MVLRFLLLWGALGPLLCAGCRSESPLPAEISKPEKLPSKAAPPRPPAPIEVVKDVELPPPPLPPTYINAPKLKGTKISPAKKRSRVTFQWQKVRRATGYQLQVSRDITFQQLDIKTKTKKPRHQAGPFDPGIHFWRVRAIGPKGASLFTPTQVLDTTLGKKKKQGLRKGKPKPSSETPSTPLIWDRPAELSVFASKVITVAGQAPRGAKLRVGFSQKVECDSTFSLAHTLNPGRNNLTLTAEIDGKISILNRQVFLVLPEEIEGDRYLIERSWRSAREFRTQVQILEDILVDLKNRANGPTSKPMAMVLQREIARLAKDMARLTHLYEIEVGKIDLLLRTDAKP